MPSFPTLEITAVVGCRIGCDYCPQSKFTRAYAQRPNSNIRHMSLETFQVCVDKTPSNCHVDFSGFAEPWLNQHATDMLLYIAPRRTINVYTTLIGWTKNDVDRIREAYQAGQIKFNDFVIHLADKHNRMKISPTQEFAELIQYFVQAKFPCVYMGMRDIHPFYHSLIPMGRVTIQRPISRAANVHPNEAAPIKIKTGSLGCRRCPNYNNNVLLPNGDVVLCCADWALEVVLGNLLVDPYEQLAANFNQHFRPQLHNNGNIICRRCEDAIRIPEAHHVSD